MNFKKKYGINEEVDFQDIELETDNELFVDPYLVYLSKTEIGANCSNRIVNYFEQLLSCAKTNDRQKGYYLVKYLQENNEVRLGYSRGTPCGRGLGKNKGEELFNHLCNSKAVKSGLVADIFDAGIMIENIGYDRISDLTINIILEVLIDYTLEECEKYSVPLEMVSLKRPIWSLDNNAWVKIEAVMLPVHNGKPIILIPKHFMHPTLVYTYDRFYNKLMMPFYERQVIRNSSSGLMKILKRGPVPSRTKIRKEYPCLKIKVVEFIEIHPEEYQTYKYKQLKYVNINNV